MESLPAALKQSSRINERLRDVLMPVDLVGSEHHPSGALAAQPLRVALVCMPFASAQRPSIQIALMTAIAQREGFETDAFHFNIDLAVQLSPELYENLCEHRGRMTGEWLFGSAAFGLRADGYFEAFPEEVLWAEKIGKDRNYLIELRERVLSDFLEKCLAAVDWDRYRVVGFSSTFQQNVGSLALARRIKERHPDVTIVFGGANMESEMGLEYARAFPFIDFVVSGEGDAVFPALLHGLNTNKLPTQLPGLVARSPDGLRTAGQAAPLTDLNASPVPNYDDYFEQAIAAGLLPHYQKAWAIPFESSRGCWWGHKHHCTFCGLNGLGMRYRAKSADRVLAELTELAGKHLINSFEAVDNILDLKYLPALFSQIEQAKVDYRFFYEVKANLTRAQLHTLYKGGVRSIQPGIESMSSRTLQLMRKGCTMLQNVRCLKWCAYYDIGVSWNLLCGFPGERPEDYERQFEILKCLGHLEPPQSISRIWLERFSPYYTDRETFPVRNVRPEASYRHVYPDHVNLESAAYFFDYDMGDTVPAELLESTRALVVEWKNNWEKEETRHSLNYRRTSDGIMIDYNWGQEKNGTYRFSGPLALIYESCVETMQTAEKTTEHLRNAPQAYRFSIEEVRDAMDTFCRQRLMLSEDGKYLSLAIPSNPNW
jgi:ribosomal peptide maturation radical SAM protein 1